MIKRFSRRIYSIYQKRYAIKSPSVSDVYIVSYPKSGTTWLSFLIANLNCLLNNKTYDVTWFNIHNLVPDIHLSRSPFQCSMLSTDIVFHRFIKSHSIFNPHYSTVIYLSRSPVDVLKSYYKMTVQLGHHRMAPSSFIRHPLYGAASWSQHILSWFLKPDPAVSFHHIRYEDLLSNTEASLSSLYASLGYRVSTDLLTKAIGNSSLTTMRQLESAQSYGGRPISHQLQFVGSPYPSQMLSFSDQDISFILSSTVEARTLLGYI